MDWPLAATKNPGWSACSARFRARTPQMYVDVDRERCKAMSLPLNDVFLTLQLYLGGYYTNDFNQFGRTWQVNLQADPQFRLRPESGSTAKSPQSIGGNGPPGKCGERQRNGGPRAGRPL